MFAPPAQPCQGDPLEALAPVEPGATASHVAQIKSSAIETRAALSVGDLGLLDAPSAAELMATLSSLESAMHAAMCELAALVASSTHWQHGGHRRAGDWVGAVTGQSPHHATSMIRTGKRLATKPALRRAAYDGEVSPDKLHELAAATDVDPATTGRLLSNVARRSFREVRQDCTAARAAATDDATKRRRTRAKRGVTVSSSWDGTSRLSFVDATHNVAKAKAAIDYIARHLQRADANRQTPPPRTADVEGSGQRGRADDPAAQDGEGPTPYGSFLADALLLLLETSMAELAPAAPRPREPGDDAPNPPCAAATETDAEPVGPSERLRLPPTLRRSKGGANAAIEPKIIVRIDHAALVRGDTGPGEVCEIAGLGPIPVSTVREMLDDAFLALVVTKGVDVINVAHRGRRPSAHQRSALQWRFATCSTTGCANTAFLEWDHNRPWADCQITELENLIARCSHCHHLKTNHGYLDHPVTGELVPPHRTDRPGCRDRRARPPNRSDRAA